MKAWLDIVWFFVSFIGSIIWFIVSFGQNDLRGLITSTFILLFWYITIMFEIRDHK